MGMPEPNDPHGFWATIKDLSVDTLWPPDDETQVFRLAAVWNAKADAVEYVAGQYGNFAGQVTGVWRDGNGSAFAQNLAYVGGFAKGLAAMMRGVAVDMDDYARRIVEAKIEIWVEVFTNAALFGAYMSVPWLGWAARLLARSAVQRITAKIVGEAAAIANRGAAKVVRGTTETLGEGIQEMFDEGTNRVLNNAANQLTGNRPDRGLTDGLGRAMTVGGGSALLAKPLGTFGEPLARSVNNTLRAARVPGGAADHITTAVDSFTRNGITSPVGEQSFGNAYDGNWSEVVNGQGYLDAIGKDGISAGILGAGRSNTTLLGNQMNVVVHGPPPGGVQPSPQGDSAFINTAGGGPNTPPPSSAQPPGAGDLTGPPAAGQGAPGSNAPGQPGGTAPPSATAPPGAGSAAPNAAPNAAGSGPPNVDAETNQPGTDQSTTNESNTGPAGNQSMTNEPSDNGPIDDDLAGAPADNNPDNNPGNYAPGDAGTAPDGPGNGQSASNETDAGRQPEADEPTGGHPESDQPRTEQSATGQPVDAPADSDVSGPPPGTGQAPTSAPDAGADGPRSDFRTDEQNPGFVPTAGASAGAATPSSVGGGTAAPAHTVSGPVAGPVRNTLADPKERDADGSVAEPAATSAAAPARPDEVNPDTTPDATPDQVSANTPDETDKGDDAPAQVEVGGALAAAAAKVAEPDTGPEPRRPGPVPRHTRVDRDASDPSIGALTGKTVIPAPSSPLGRRVYSGTARWMAGFVAKAERTPEVALTERMIRELIHQVADAAGIESIERKGDAYQGVRKGEGLGEFRFHVVVGETNDGNPAEFTVGDDGIGIIVVSPRLVSSTTVWLRGTTVKRALAHEISELNEVLLGNDDPNVAHAHGREAELRVLDAEYRAAEPGAANRARRATLRHHMRLLTQELAELSHRPAVPHAKLPSTVEDGLGAQPDDRPLSPVRPEGQSLGVFHESRLTRDADGRITHIDRVTIDEDGVAQVETVPAQQVLHELTTVRARQYWNAYRVETGKEFTDQAGNRVEKPEPLEVESPQRPAVEVNQAVVLDPDTGRPLRTDQRNRIGNMMALVLDTRTGEVFEETNGPKKSDIPLDQVHPQLRERGDALPKHDGYPRLDAHNRPYEKGPARRDMPGSDPPYRHAGVRGANMALHSNSTTRISDLVVDPRSIQATGTYPASCCPNCSALLHDAVSNTGKRVYNPETDSYDRQRGQYEQAATEPVASSGREHTGAAKRMAGFGSKYVRIPLATLTTRMVESLIGDTHANEQIAKAAGVAEITKKDGKYVAVREGPSEFKFTLSVGTTPNGNPAKVTVAADGSVDIVISETLIASTTPWMRRTALKRALAHEIAEANSILLRNTDAEVAHSHGRQAELRILDGDHRAATGVTRLARRTAMRQHMRLLAEDMRVHPTQDGSQQRKVRLAQDVERVVDQHFPVGSRPSFHALLQERNDGLPSHKWFMATALVTDTVPGFAVGLVVGTVGANPVFGGALALSALVTGLGNGVLGRWYAKLALDAADARRAKQAEQNAYEAAQRIKQILDPLLATFRGTAFADPAHAPAEPAPIAETLTGVPALRHRFVRWLPHLLGSGAATALLPVGPYPMPVDPAAPPGTPAPVAELSTRTLIGMWGASLALLSGAPFVEKWLRNKQIAAELAQLEVQGEALTKQETEFLEAVVADLYMILAWIDTIDGIKSQPPAVSAPPPRPPDDHGGGPKAVHFGVSLSPSGAAPAVRAIVDIAGRLHGLEAALTATLGISRGAISTLVGAVVDRRFHENEMRITDARVRHDLTVDQAFAQQQRLELLKKLLDRVLAEVQLAARQRTLGPDPDGAAEPMGAARRRAHAEEARARAAADEARIEARHAALVAERARAAHAAAELVRTQAKVTDADHPLVREAADAAERAADATAEAEAAERRAADAETAAGLSPADTPAPSDNQTSGQNRPVGHARRRLLHKAAQARTAAENAHTVAAYTALVADRAEVDAAQARAAADKAARAAEAAEAAAGPRSSKPPGAVERRRGIQAVEAAELARLADNRANQAEKDAAEARRRADDAAAVAERASAAARAAADRAGLSAEQVDADTPIGTPLIGKVPPAAPEPRAVPLDPPAGPPPSNVQSKAAFVRHGALRETISWSLVAGAAWAVNTLNDTPIFPAYMVAALGTASALAVGGWVQRWRERGATAQAEDRLIEADRADAQATSKAAQDTRLDYAANVLLREVAVEERLTAVPEPDPDLEPTAPPSMTPTHLDAGHPWFTEYVRTMVGLENRALAQEPRPYLLFDRRLRGLARLDAELRRIDELRGRTGDRREHDQAVRDLADTWFFYQRLMVTAKDMPAPGLAPAKLAEERAKYPFELGRRPKVPGPLLPSMADALADSRETPDGRAFYPAGDTASHTAAQDADPKEGYYNAHFTADARGVRVGRRRFSIAEFATIVRHDPTWRRQPVWAHAGLTDEQVAQLEQELGVRVRSEPAPPPGPSFTGAAAAMPGATAKANRPPRVLQTFTWVEKLLGDTRALDRIAEAAGLAAIEATGPRDGVAIQANGNEIPFHIRVGPTENGNPAELAVANGRAVITIAPTMLASTPLWMRSIALKRLLGHELSEINQRLLGNDNPDLLTGKIPGARTELSAHDHGRQTELRLLDEEYRGATGPTRVLKRVALRHHMRLLAEETAVHPTRDNSQQLKARLDSDVERIVDRHFPVGSRGSWHARLGPQGDGLQSHKSFLVTALVTKTLPGFGVGLVIGVGLGSPAFGTAIALSALGAGLGDGLLGRWYAKKAKAAAKEIKIREAERQAYEYAVRLREMIDELLAMAQGTAYADSAHAPAEPRPDYDQTLTGSPALPHRLLRASPAVFGAAAASLMLPLAPPAPADPAGGVTSSRFDLPRSVLAMWLTGIAVTVATPFIERWFQNRKLQGRLTRFGQVRKPLTEQEAEFASAVVEILRMIMTWIDSVDGTRSQAPVTAPQPAPPADFGDGPKLAHFGVRSSRRGLQSILRALLHYGHALPDRDAALAGGLGASRGLVAMLVGMIADRVLFAKEQNRRDDRDRHELTKDQAFDQELRYQLVKDLLVAILPEIHAARLIRALGFDPAVTPVGKARRLELAAARNADAEARRARITAEYTAMLAEQAHRHATDARAAARSAAGSDAAAEAEARSADADAASEQATRRAEAAALRAGLPAPPVVTADRSTSPGGAKPTNAATRRLHTNAAIANAAAQRARITAEYTAMRAERAHRDATDASVAVDRARLAAEAAEAATAPRSERPVGAAEHRHRARAAEWLRAAEDRLVRARRRVRVAERRAEAAARQAASTAAAARAAAEKAGLSATDVDANTPVGAPMLSTPPAVAPEPLAVPLAQPDGPAPTPVEERGTYVRFGAIVGTAGWGATALLAYGVNALSVNPIIPGFLIAAFGAASMIGVGGWVARWKDRMAASKAKDERGDRKRGTREKLGRAAQEPRLAYLLNAFRREIAVQGREDAAVTPDPRFEPTAPPSLTPTYIDASHPWFTDLVRTMVRLERAALDQEPRPVLLFDARLRGLARLTDDLNGIDELRGRAEETGDSRALDQAVRDLADTWFFYQRLMAIAKPMPKPGLPVQELAEERAKHPFTLGRRPRIPGALRPSMADALAASEVTPHGRSFLPAGQAPRETEGHYNVHVPAGVRGFGVEDIATMLWFDPNWGERNVMVTGVELSPDELAELGGRLGAEVRNAPGGADPRSVDDILAASETTPAGRSFHEPAERSHSALAHFMVPVPDRHVLHVLGAVDHVVLAGEARNMAEFAAVILADPSRGNRAVVVDAAGIGLSTPAIEELAGHLEPAGVRVESHTTTPADALLQSRVTPGGRAFFPADDAAAHAAARRAPRVPRFHTVFVKAVSGGGFEFGGRPLGTDQLATVLRNDPSWNPEQVEGVWLVDPTGRLTTRHRDEVAAMLGATVRSEDTRVGDALERSKVILGHRVYGAPGFPTEPADPDVHTVHAVGDLDGILADGHLFGVEELARLITVDPLWGRRPVRLVGPVGLRPEKLQRLEELLGVRVYGSSPVADALAASRSVRGGRSFLPDGAVAAPPSETYHTVHLHADGDHAVIDGRRFTGTELLALLRHDPTRHGKDVVLAVTGPGLAPELITELREGLGVEVRATAVAHPQPDDQQAPMPDASGRSTGRFAESRLARDADGRITGVDDRPVRDVLAELATTRAELYRLTRLVAADGAVVLGLDPRTGEVFEAPGDSVPAAVDALHATAGTDDLVLEIPPAETEPEPAAPVDGDQLAPTLENLHLHAAYAGLDLVDVDLVIVTDPDEVAYLERHGATARTRLLASGPQIRFGPASFADGETLVATIANQLTRVHQRLAGLRVTSENRDELAAEAHANEAPAVAAYHEIRAELEQDQFRAHAARGNAEVLASGAHLPLTHDVVVLHADLAEVDLAGTEVVIVTDPAELAYLDDHGAAARTRLLPTGPQIRLGPAAFVDNETLVAAIAHEMVHVRQRLDGVHVTSANRAAMEAEAHAAEASALEEFRRNVNDPIRRGEDLPAPGGRDPGVGPAGAGGDRAGDGAPAGGHGPAGARTGPGVPDPDAGGHQSVDAADRSGGPDGAPGRSGADQRVGTGKRRLLHDGAAAPVAAHETALAAAERARMAGERAAETAERAEVVAAQARIVAGKAPATEGHARFAEDRATLAAREARVAALDAEAAAGAAGRAAELAGKDQVSRRALQRDATRARIAAREAERAADQAAVAADRARRFADQGRNAAAAAVAVATAAATSAAAEPAGSSADQPTIEPAAPPTFPVRAVPHSRFRVDPDAVPNRWIGEHARGAVSRVTDDAGLRSVEEITRGHYRVTRKDGSTFVVTVVAKEVQGDHPAEVVVLRQDRGLIRVSPRLPDDLVDVAVAGALAQLGEHLAGNDAEQDLLTRDHHPGSASRLSAHDAGREAALRHLHRTRAAAAKQGLLHQRRHTRTWQALVEDMGVHPEEDGGPQRRAVASADTRHLIDGFVANTRRPSWVHEPSGYTPWKAFLPVFGASIIPGAGATAAIAGLAIASGGSLMVAAAVGVMNLGTAVAGTLVGRWYGRREKDTVDAGHGYYGKKRAHEIAVRREAVVTPLLARMRTMGIDVTVPGPAEPPPTDAEPPRVQSYWRVAVNRGLPPVVGAAIATSLLPLGLPFWNLMTHWGIAGFAAVFGPTAERYLRARMVSREWKWFDEIGRELDRRNAEFDERFATHLHSLMDRMDQIANATPPNIAPVREALPDIDVDHDPTNRYAASSAPNNAGDFSRDATEAPNRFGNAVLDSISMTGSAALDAVGSGTTRFALGVLIGAFLDREFTHDEYAKIVAQVKFDFGATMIEQAGLQERNLLAMLAEVESRVEAAEAALAARHAPPAEPTAVVPAPPNAAARPPGHRGMPEFRKQGIFQASALWGIAMIASTQFAQGPGMIIVVGFAAAGILGSFPLRFLHRRAEQHAVDRKIFADRAKERVVEAAESTAVRGFMRELMNREVAAAGRARAAGRELPPPPMPARPAVPQHLDPSDPAYPDHVRALAAYERELIFREPRPMSRLGARLVGLDRVERLAERVRMFERTGTRNTEPARQARDDLAAMWQAYRTLLDDGTPMPYDHELYLATKHQVADQLRSYLDQSQAIPGGRRFFAPGDPLRDDPTGVPASEDVYTIDGHGFTDATGRTGLRVGAHLLTEEHLDAILDADPNYHGQPILLLACGSGRGEDSLAERLADRRGVRVGGPSDFYGVDDGGTSFVTDVEVDANGIARPKFPPTGEIRWFEPGKNNIAHLDPDLVLAPTYVGVSDLDQHNPWRLRGSEHQLSRRERDLARRTIVDRRAIGGGPATSALLALLDDGSLGVLRRALAQHDVAASRVDELVGFGRVPTTTMVEDSRHGRGSLQRFVERRHLGGIIDDYSLIRQQQMAVLDYLIGHLGRKPGSYLTDPDGDPVAIGNVPSFPHGTESPIVSGFVTSQFGQWLHRDVLWPVLAVRPESMRAMLLATGVDEVAADLAVARLREIQQYKRIIGTAWDGAITDPYGNAVSKLDPDDRPPKRPGKLVQLLERRRRAHLPRPPAQRRPDPGSPWSAASGLPLEPDPEPSVPRDAGPRHITAAPVPGSTFHGNGVPEASGGHALRLTEQGAAAVRRVAAGHGELHAERLADGSHRVTDRHGSFTIEVRTARLPDDSAARSTLDHALDEHVVELSENLDSRHVDRAMAHELGEIVRERHLRAIGDLSPARDTLRPGDFEPGSELSPHDAGRIQELRVLAEQYGRLSPDDAVSLAHVRGEGLSLVDHLGIRAGTPGAAERRALIDARLGDDARTVVNAFLDHLATEATRASPTEFTTFWHDLVGHARIEAAHRETGLVDQLQQFAIQRVLARFFTENPENWVLKGGQALLARYPGSRASTDLDFTRTTDADLESMVADYERALARDLGDHLTFVRHSEQRLLDDTVVRLSHVVYLGGRELMTLGVDLTKPRPVWQPADIIPFQERALSTGVPGEAPRLRVLSLPDTLAHKVAGMFTYVHRTIRRKPGNGNTARGKGAFAHRPVATRSQDLVDVLMLAMHRSWDGPETHALLRAEIDWRWEQELDVRRPRRFTVRNLAWERSFKAHAAMTPGLPYRTLQEALPLARAFLDPLLADDPPDARWDPRQLRWVARSESARDRPGDDVRPPALSAQVLERTGHAPPSKALAGKAMIDRWDSLAADRNTPGSLDVFLDELKARTDRTLREKLQALSDLMTDVGLRPTEVTGLDAKNLRLYSYQRGELYIYSAALMADDETTVEIVYHPGRTYETFRWEAHQAHVAHTDALPADLRADQANAVAYWRASKGGGPYGADPDQLSADLIDMRAQPLRDALTMRRRLIDEHGIDPSRIRLAHPGGDRQSHYRSTTRYVRAHLFVLDAIRENPAGARRAMVDALTGSGEQGQVRARRAQDVVERLVAATPPAPEDQGDRPRRKFALLWVRDTRDQPVGSRHGPHLDTRPEMLRQTIEALRESHPDVRPVLLGDDLFARRPELLESWRSDGVLDGVDTDTLVNFWEAENNGGERLTHGEQALFFHRLAEQHDVVQIGMLSGAMELPAILGVPTVYLQPREHDGNKGNRWALYWQDWVHGKYEPVLDTDGSQVFDDSGRPVSTFEETEVLPAPLPTVQRVLYGPDLPDPTDRRGQPSTVYLPAKVSVTADRIVRLVDSGELDRWAQRLGRTAGLRAEHWTSWSDQDWERSRYYVDQLHRWLHTDAGTPDEVGHKWDGIRLALTGVVEPGFDRDEQYEGSAIVHPYYLLHNDEPLPGEAAERIREAFAAEPGERASAVTRVLKELLDAPGFRQQAVDDLRVFAFDPTEIELLRATIDRLSRGTG